MRPRTCGAGGRRTIVAAKRERLATRMLGAVDARTPGKFETLGVLDEAKKDEAAWTAERVRWPVFDGVWGRGGCSCVHVERRRPSWWHSRMRMKRRSNARGWRARGVRRGNWHSGWCKSGCVVVVPTLVSRSDEFSGSGKTRTVYELPASRVDLPAGIRGRADGHRIGSAKGFRGAGCPGRCRPLQNCRVRWRVMARVG